MSQSIALNFNMYPLVVGQEDKFTFQNWEKEGATIQLVPAILDSAYTEDDVVWYSTDEEVATVEKGLVRAVRTGIADIYAVLPKNKGESGACSLKKEGLQGENCASCRIQVIDNNGRLTTQHAVLNADRIILNVLEGCVLRPIVLPVDYFENGMLDTAFTWTSSDPDVAVVNHQGHVWGKACGSAVITGVSKDVGRRVSCQIEVIEKKKEELYIDPLEDLQGEHMFMKAGEKKAVVLPDPVKNQPVCWRSLNAGIAGVTKDGIVQAYRAGTVTVLGTFINGGRTISCPVQIEKEPEHPVTEIHLNQYECRLAKGQKTNIYAAVYPAVLLEKQLEWSSTNESVFQIVRQHINLSGLDEVIIEAVGEGTAYLTGHCGKFTVRCQVSVAEKEIQIKKITLPETVLLEPQQIARLAPVYNEDAVDTEVVWLSENRYLATVDREGVIKAYDVGKVHIYCISKASLDEKDRTVYRQLSDARCIKGSPKEEEALEKLLSHAVYAVCSAEVSDGRDYLSNLHIPDGSVTNNSVCLLWNRKSRLDVKNLAGYHIYQDGNKIAFTDTLGYTVKKLSADREYTFEVAAVDLEGRECARTSVRVHTKPSDSAVLDVTKAPYYAAGDGVATDTGAIQKAIDDCPEGGRVLLPKGYVFYSGALFLKSNMTLQIDGILFGSQDPDDYPPIVCRWEGYRKMRLTKENQDNTVPVFENNVYSHASLLNVGVYDEGRAGELSPYHTKHVCICGEGMINGNSFALAYNEGPCWYVQRKGLSIPQSPKTDQNIRGRVLAMYNTKHAYVSDLTVAYGPSWTIHPVFCDDVTFDNVKIISMGNGRTGVMEGMLTLNGDGIDPDSSTNINITGCYFTVGDDAVAIKSGRNRQGNELDKPSAYIRVTDCVCRDAKGSFAVGSEQSGGVHDVLFQNLYVENITNFGLWIKSAPCRGGLVEDIWYRDCILKSTGGALQIEYEHGGDENPALVLPQTRRVTYENITLAGRNKFGMRILGVPDSKISDVEFRGVSFEEFEAYKKRKFVMRDCADIRFTEAGLPEGYEWELEDGKERLT